MKEGALYCLFGGAVVAGLPTPHGPSGRAVHGTRGGQYTKEAGVRTGISKFSGWQLWRLVDMCFGAVAAFWLAIMWEEHIDAFGEQK